MFVMREVACTRLLRSCCPLRLAALINSFAFSESGNATTDPQGNNTVRECPATAVSVVEHNRHPFGVSLLPRVYAHLRTKRQTISVPITLHLQV